MPMTKEKSLLITLIVKHIEHKVYLYTCRKMSVRAFHYKLQNGLARLSLEKNIMMYFLSSTCVLQKKELN